jgi:prepilin-type N-terminal cleavage/methylation domain-containing protein
MINTKLPHLTNRYGFTLIELVVAFSIMAVLSTIGVAAFLNYTRGQSLQQATNDLVSTLNTAKADAVSQIKPNDPNCLPLTQQEKVLSGYKVILSKATTPNSYTLYAVCDGVNVPVPPATATIPTVKLPNGVSFDSSTFVSPATTMTITFFVLTGGVASNGVIDATGNTTIVLDGYTGTTPKTITVTSGGLIE